MLKFLLALYAAALVSAQFNVDDECRTPAGKRGTCIPIQRCNFIINWLQSAPQPLTQATIQELQNYQCGYSGGTPNVCCPNDSTPATTPTSVTTTTVATSSRGPARKDVSNHVNIGLINQRTCGSGIADKIVGGNQTSPFDFPWMALIAYDTGAGLDFRCGGTLINERYILTAAHCITNLDSLRLVGVRLGEHNIQTAKDCVPLDDEGNVDCAPPVQDFRIEEVIPHEDFSSSRLVNDIGLLRLAAPAILRSNVKAICLPVGDLSSDSLVGQNVTVAGWGVTETGYSSKELLKALLPVVRNTECQARYNESKVEITLINAQMCAGGIPGVDSCSGDSGGPLKKQGTINNDSRMVQYGIVSFGPRFCGQERQPGVYTRVDYYMDWILDHIRA